MNRLRCLFLIAVGCGLIGMIVLFSPPVSAFQPVFQETLTATPPFLRTVESSVVRIINAVRVRTEPGTAAGQDTVIRTAQFGEEFAIRPGLDPVTADGYTWLPIIVDGADAWVAQEGFLEEAVGQVPVPVEQSEVEQVYEADLPVGASSVVAVDGQLFAVSAEGDRIRVWDWGDQIGRGAWVEIHDRNVNPAQVLDVDDPNWRDDLGGLVQDRGDSYRITREILTGTVRHFDLLPFNQVETDLGVFTLEMHADIPNTTGAYQGPRTPIIANGDTVTDHYRKCGWGEQDVLFGREQYIYSGLEYFYIELIKSVINYDQGDLDDAELTRAAQAWFEVGRPIPVTLVRDNTAFARDQDVVFADGDKIEVRYVNPRAGLSLVILPQLDMPRGYWVPPMIEQFPELMVSVRRLNTNQALTGWGFGVGTDGRLIVFIHYSGPGYDDWSGSFSRLETMFFKALNEFIRAQAGTRDRITRYNVMRIDQTEGLEPLYAAFGLVPRPEWTGHDGPFGFLIDALGIPLNKDGECNFIIQPTVFPE